jgi:hypothetical protein
MLPPLASPPDDRNHQAINVLNRRCESDGRIEGSNQDDRVSAARRDWKASNTDRGCHFPVRICDLTSKNVNVGAVTKPVLRTNPSNVAAAEMASRMQSR